MARVSVHYTRFSNSRLATFFSFIGGTLFTLCVIPGVMLFAASFLQLVTGGFSDGESWGMLGASVLLGACGFGIGFVLNLIFDKIARAIARHKAKKSIKP